MSKRGKLNPSALSVEETVKVLNASKSEYVSAEKIQADIKNGAPVNPDGTINLVHYASWLVWEISHERD